MTNPPPAHLDRLEGQRLDARVGHARRPPQRALHRAGLSSARASPEWEDPEGVPISAILFGGRRATTVPLVTEAFDWEHGVFLGSDHGVRRRPPRPPAPGRRRPPRSLRDAAVLRLQHGRLLRPLARDRRTSRRDADKLPKLFWVNWFRKGDDGKFLWPGYGENSRVLKWVVERLEGKAEAVETPIGTCRPSRRSTAAASTSTTRRWRRSWPSTPRRGGPRSPTSRSTSSSSANTSRQDADELNKLEKRLVG